MDEDQDTNLYQKWRYRKYMNCGLKLIKTFISNSQKSRQENTEELHKKDPVDLDNHNGAMAHLEPDI